VEVARPDAAPQRVTADERATVRPQQSVQVTREDRSATDRRLAWRDGMVSFSGETLANAVREVNRYSRRKIEIDDPSLATKPVIGIFRVGDVDGFAQTAAVALGADVHAEDGVLRLTAVHRP
jgi:transmembrane sensor